MSVDRVDPLRTFVAALADDLTTALQAAAQTPTGELTLAAARAALGLTPVGPMLDFAGVATAAWKALRSGTDPKRALYVQSLRFDALTRAEATNLAARFRAAVRERRFAGSQLASTAAVVEDVCRYLEFLPGHVQRSSQGTQAQLRARRADGRQAFAGDQARAYLPVRVPQLTVGQYLEVADVTCKRLIGMGGFGEVWLTEDRMGGLFALKVTFDPKAIQSVARESALLVRLEQAAVGDHVVRLYRHGHTADCAWLLMDYVEGVTLLDWMRGFGGRIPVVEVLVMADRILASLGAVHTAGIVHGDVKPANVLLAGDGSVKLADLGLGVAADANMTNSVAMAWGMTESYASDRRRRTGVPDARDDLHAVGVATLQMLVGDPEASANASKLNRMRAFAPGNVAKWVETLLDDEREPELNAAQARSRLRKLRQWQTRNLALVVSGLRAATLGTVRNWQWSLQVRYLNPNAGLLGDLMVYVLVAAVVLCAVGVPVVLFVSRGLSRTELRNRIDECDAGSAQACTIVAQAYADGTHGASVDSGFAATIRSRACRLGRMDHCSERERADIERKERQRAAADEAAAIAWRAVAPMPSAATPASLAPDSSPGSTVGFPGAAR